MIRQVNNLEFPSWCHEMTIFGYRFYRVEEYRERLLRLQHRIHEFAEFEIKPNTGGHAITANVEIPEREEAAALGWSGSGNTALADILLLLCLFTKRDVFLDREPENDAAGEDKGDIILADPRGYYGGGLLRCSIPYKKKISQPGSFGYDVGLEEGLDQVYRRMRSDEWRREYRNGYFLFLARMAFHWQLLDATFVQCWTIWEHLFAIHNQGWLSDKKIAQLSAVEKVSFLLIRYGLREEIDDVSRKRIESLAEIRNKLVHFGRLPERDAAFEDAILFIRLTEFIIAKTLGLWPSDVYGTVEKLEAFLQRQEAARKQKSQTEPPL